MSDEKNEAEPSGASGGYASLSMTPEEFYSTYGDELVAFAEYYKYMFYFRATLADGRMLVVGYGGDADQIYRYGVKAGDSVKVRDLMPHTARVYDGDREVAVFLDY